MGLFNLFSKNGRSSEEEDTTDGETIYDDYDEDDDDDYGETLSVYDAADYWMSSGKDEDYMFGYSQEELEAALNS